MNDQTAAVFDEGQGLTKHMFSAEASTLGWRPGQVVSLIVAHGRTFVLRNVEKDREGDVQLWRYDAGDGSGLIVFND